MTIKRNGSAVWSGGLKDGKGAVSTGSGVLKDAQYGFNTRFEDGPGTNPEELIGAAHAGCFTMALSGQLGQAGMTAQELRTTATVSMEKVEGGFSITAVHLDLVAKIPGASQEAFDKAANTAKENCPVSKLLTRTSRSARSWRAERAGAGKEHGERIKWLLSESTRGHHPCAFCTPCSASATCNAPSTSTPMCSA